MNKQKKQELRSRAHALKPIVITGQAGVTPALVAEIDGALEHHELLKVRINAGDRDERNSMLNEITASLTAEVVQVIGHVATLFRAGPRRVS